MVWVEGNYEGLVNRALLFDLAWDPLERQDLSAQQPEVVQHLQRLLAERREAAHEPLPASSAEHTWTKGCCRPWATERARSGALVGRGAKLSVPKHDTSTTA